MQHGLPLIIEQRQDVRHGRCADQDHIIAGPAIKELILAGSGTDRVIPGFAKKALTIAGPALQAIGIVATN